MEPPPYKDFGLAEYNDPEGREYRRRSSHPPGVLNPQRAWDDELVLFARIPIRRRTRKERLRATPIGGNTRNVPGMPGSLSGGMWNPKWPQPGDTVRLMRIGTTEVYEGRVDGIFAKARRSTATVRLYSPGLKRIQ